MPVYLLKNSKWILIDVSILEYIRYFFHKSSRFVLKKYIKNFFIFLKKKKIMLWNIFAHTNRISFLDRSSLFILWVSKKFALKLMIVVFSIYNIHCFFFFFLFWISLAVCASRKLTKYNNYRTLGDYHSLVAIFYFHTTLMLSRMFFTDEYEEQNSQDQS